uniref:Uncharacterized protein n=1 Tax=Gokushovirinae environmental samples TaxID=1478972 RepID=A0A2R3UAC6_9VIRU|nr:hypothetical protein [Gokushovirinae environmental samples]
MKRHKTHHSGSYFTKHASKTHRRNVPTRIPMRGGIRM